MRLIKMTSKEDKIDQNQSKKADNRSYLLENRLMTYKIKRANPIEDFISLEISLMIIAKSFS